MKYFIKTLLKFLLFVTIVYIFLLCVLGFIISEQKEFNLLFIKRNSGFLYSRINEVKKTKNIDILFVGSSHTYRGFDTRIFKVNGYKTFNLGSSNQTPIQTNTLIKRYVDKLNPELVIYEVYPLPFSLDGVESSLDLLSNENIDKNTFYELFKINNIKVYNTFIYSLCRQFLGLNKNKIENDVYFEDKYITGGYVERKLVLNKELKPQERKVIIFNDKQFDSFISSLQILKRKKIKYILVQAPVTKVLYNSIINNNQIDSIFHSKGKYYNFNNLIKLSDTNDFYDKGHLNQHGVIKFNNNIIQILKNDNIITY